MCTLDKFKLIGSGPVYMVAGAVVQHVENATMCVAAYDHRREPEVAFRCLFLNQIYQQKPVAQWCTCTRPKQRHMLKRLTICHVHVVIDGKMKHLSPFSSPLPVQVRYSTTSWPMVE